MTPSNQWPSTLTYRQVQKQGSEKWHPVTLNPDRQVQLSTHQLKNTKDSWYQRQREKYLKARGVGDHSSLKVKRERWSKFTVFDQRVITELRSFIFNFRHRHRVKKLTPSSQWPSTLIYGLIYLHVNPKNYSSTKDMKNTTEGGEFIRFFQPQGQ